MVWIPGNLLAAPTPAVMAAVISDPDSAPRLVMDGLYLPDFASEAEAVAGVNLAKVLSPGRAREAHDAWMAAAVARVATIRYSSGSWTLPAGTHTLLGINDGGRWSTEDPANVLATVGGADIRVREAGLYRLSASIALGLSTDASAQLAFGWAKPGESTSIQGTYGYGETVKSGVLMVNVSTPPMRLSADEAVRPRIYLGAARAFSAAENISRNFLTVEYLGK